MGFRLSAFRYVCTVLLIIYSPDTMHQDNLISLPSAPRPSNRAASVATDKDATEAFIGYGMVSFAYGGLIIEWLKNTRGFCVEGFLRCTCKEKRAKPLPSPQCFRADAKLGGGFRDNSNTCFKWFVAKPESMRVFLCKSVLENRSNDFFFIYIIASQGYFNRKNQLGYILSPRKFVFVQSFDEYTGCPLIKDDLDLINGF